MEVGLLPAGGSAVRLRLWTLYIAAQCRLRTRLRISAASHGGRLCRAVRLRTRTLPDVPRTQLSLAVAYVARFTV